MTRILTSARPLGGAARPAPLSPAGSTAAAQTKYNFKRIFVQHCLSTCEADWIGYRDEALTARDDAQLLSRRQWSCDTSMNAPFSGIVQICIVIGMQDDGI